MNIELLAFYAYFFTMVMYLFRSRFMSVGINQTVQFESVYMSFLANKVIDNMNFDINQEKRQRW
jgi:hypothetical protein